MDDLCRGFANGRHHAGWCHVSVVATDDAVRSVVLECRYARPGRVVLRTGHCAVNFLCDHDYRGQSGDLDISSIIR